MPEYRCLHLSLAKLQRILEKNNKSSNYLPKLDNLYQKTPRGMGASSPHIWLKVKKETNYSLLTLFILKIKQYL